MSCVIITCPAPISCEIQDTSLNHPGVRNLAQQIESVLGFFVVEAKDRDVKLDDHIPQVLMQLYAAATKLNYGSHLHFQILQS
jgi:hypothetical protein